MLIQRRQSGFTIAELLIAVALTSAIVVMLGTMFNSLTTTASHASQRIDAFRDARAALHLIERDLTGIVRADKTAYFALDDRYSDPFAGTPKNQQVYALVSTKNTGSGDLCAVGYYCRWDSGRHTYSLRRYFRNSNELMADATYFSNQNPSRSVPPWNIRANGVGTYMRSDSLYQPSDIDDPATNKFKDDVLASYVWNFQITAYNSDGTVNTSYPLIIDPASSTTAPASLEIAFNAISPEAARTLMSMNPSPSDWMDTNTQGHKMLEPHTYEFRTRINL